MIREEVKKIILNILLNLFIIFVIAIVLYPVLWVVKLALSEGQSLSLSLSPIPEKVSLNNFKEVIIHKGMDGAWLFGYQLLNSIVISGATTLIGVILSATSAYSFSRFDFPGKKFGMNFLLITQMFPGVVMAIPLYILLDTLHLLNSMVGLVLVYSTTAIPFCIWMLKGYFDTIPKEIEEAALIDGASRGVIFLKIVLPLARPALVVTALFSFMTAWNEFILAATFLSEEKSFTLPVMLQRYVGEYNAEWGHFAAGSILVSIPVMILFFVLQRHLVRGLTSGSVKG